MLDFHQIISSKDDVSPTTVFKLSGLLRNVTLVVFDQNIQNYYFVVRETECFFWQAVAISTLSVCLSVSLSI